MDKDLLINKICGKKLGTLDIDSIKSDPNFVFTNDPNFETLVLYGPDGSVINVNSWLECANYVNGGWLNNIIQNTNYEKYYFYFVTAIAVGLFIKNIFKLSYVKK